MNSLALIALSGLGLMLLYIILIMQNAPGNVRTIY